jgi:hypothetical protein
MKKSIRKVFTILVFALALYYVVFFNNPSINRQFEYPVRQSNDNSLKRSLIKNALKNISYREDFGSFFEKVGYKTAVEIGVQSGRYAEVLIRNWPSLEAYFGIDPYAFQKNYYDSANVDNNRQTYIYEQTKKRLEKIGGSRVKLIRDFSMNVVHLFKDNSIDFIYLDGRHDFCAVTEELEAYYPKVSCNGLMAGHDYLFANKTGLGDGRDYSICENGKKVVIRGGAVKGKCVFNHATLFM